MICVGWQGSRGCTVRLTGTAVFIEILADNKDCSLMRLRVAALALAVPVLLLAGCGTNSTTGSGTGTSASGSVDPSAGVSGSETAPASSEAPMPGPTVPPETVVASPVPADQLPAASGKFGEKPAFTFPKTPAPPSLQRQILSAGTGAEIKAGDWLITHYLGQIWNGKVFDNSYDRKKTTAFQLGKVVPGWNVGLVGTKVGSRVLLSLPPADGYTSAGNPDAGIKGSDTIVFIIDIVDSVSKDRGGQADAKAVALPKTAPAVGGKPGQQPTVKIATGTAEPTKAQTLPVATGTGAKVAADDQLLVQYQAVSWDGQPAGSTWPTTDPAAQAAGGGSGPQQVQVTKDSPFAGLAGVPIGSRVLLLIPKSTTQQGQSPSLAVVLDIVAKT